jgi:hypothetical protein
MLGDAVSAKKSSGDAPETLEVVDVAQLLARSVSMAGARVADDAGSAPVGDATAGAATDGNAGNGPAPVTPGPASGEAAGDQDGRGTPAG